AGAAEAKRGRGGGEAQAPRRGRGGGEAQAPKRRRGEGEARAWRGRSAGAAEGEARELVERELVEEGWFFLGFPTLYLFGVPGEPTDYIDTGHVPVDVEAHYNHYNIPRELHDDGKWNIEECQRIDDKGNDDVRHDHPLEPLPHALVIVQRRTSHMFNNPNAFADIRQAVIDIEVADGSHIKSAGTGNVALTQSQGCCAVARPSNRPSTDTTEGGRRAKGEGSEPRVVMATAREGTGLTAPTDATSKNELATEADDQLVIRQLEARLAEVTAQRDHSLQTAFAATAAAEKTARRPSESDRAVAKLIRDKLRLFTVRNFFSQFEQYADYARLEPSARVVAIGAMLADEAAAWYQSLAGLVPNFTEFRKLFLHRWGDPLKEENTRRWLASLEQTGLTRQYTEEFRRLALLLRDLTEADKFFAYKRGLSDGLQRDLRVMQVTSLEEAISGHPQSGQARRLGPLDNGPVPMDLGAVATTREPTPDMGNYNDFLVFPHLTELLDFNTAISEAEKLDEIMFQERLRQAKKLDWGAPAGGTRPPKEPLYAPASFDIEARVEGLPVVAIVNSGCTGILLSEE
ncbi:MAG: hypothetical protein BJ554DRAFT_7511, partial [Olpidium bornovanus]